MDINDYTIEEIVKEFEGNKFLTDDEYEVLRHAEELREKQDRLLEQGFQRLTNYEEEIPNLEDQEDDFRDVMYDHAYEHGFEWDGKKFWVASRC